MSIPKYAALLVITVACTCTAACATRPEAPSTAGVSSTTSADQHLESPAAPIGQLTTGGEHCFRTPLDVAAAAARIEAFYAYAMQKYEAARRTADAGGPLPAAGTNEMGEVSNPDPSNYIRVSTYLYEDRYWLPPPPTTPQR